MDNPFKYGGVVRGPHFADRMTELDELTREMKSLGRIFLVSPRRYGKTCLLFNLIDRLGKLKMPAAYIDLNAHPDLKSFAAALTTETARALETNKEKLIKLVSEFQRLRPNVSVGADGSLSVGLEVSDHEKDPLAAVLEGLDHAERLASKKRKKLVVIIDEFSDLAKYDGQILEKALRSEIQKHEHVGYLMSGSKQSVMLAMVQERSRPFYKLGRIMELGPIPRDVYTKFIKGWLKKGGYQTKKKDLEKIFSLGQDVPYNIQRLCHTLWELARTRKKITPALIKKLPEIIVRQDSPHYELLWQTATQLQRALLIALSMEKEAGPFSKEFMLKYGIGPPSSIKASLDSLVNKGILYKSVKGSYLFSDAFMPYWIDYLRRERPAES